MPLLGVMGAFVFAAQMINFPVGIGTTGHLVGGALLAYALGPAAAAIVMTAILATQALIFQDGGILALGANVLNMAIAGVLAGYLPFQVWGRGPHRKAAIFLGGFLSLMVSAVLALSELTVSGVRMPPAVLGVSLSLFVVSAVLEGAITLAVVQALEAINPGFIRQPRAERSLAIWVLAGVSIFLSACGIALAASNPDGIERLIENAGIASHTQKLMVTPLSNYKLASAHYPWLGQALAGLAGLLVVYALCAFIGRAIRRSRRIASVAEGSA